MKYKKLLSITMAAIFTLSLNFTGVLGGKVFAADNSKGKTDYAVPANNLITAVNDDNGSSNLVNAFIKNTQITSEEIKQNCTLNIDFGDIDLDKLGIPADQQSTVKMALNILKNVPINVDTKYVSNADKTKIQMESNNDISISAFDIAYKQWVNIDTVKGLPVENVIMEIPDSIKPFMSMINQQSTQNSSDMSNKKYIVFDTSKLQQENDGEPSNSMSSEQYKEIIRKAQDFAGQFLSEVFKCAENTKSGIVTKISDNNYKISFNNVSMKAFIEQALNDKNITDGLLDYLVTVVNISSGDSGNIISSGQLKNQWGKLIDSLKNSIGEIEKYMDAVTFNIEENYSINADGYINGTNGKFSIALNNSIPADNMDSELSALANLKVSMESSSEISNINGNVTLDPVPTITADNSIDLSSYIINSISKSDPSLNNQVKRYEEQVKASEEINSNASKWDKKQSKDVKKSWKISFNKDLDPSTVNDTSVMVIDDNFEPVECTIACTGGTIVVTPVNSYQAGKTYHIYLSTAIADKNGKHLSKAIHQDFVVNP